jgi:hypothetical protein
MNRPYRVGETVLMNYQGWLKAFRVVGAHEVLEGDVVHVEYQLQMLEMEGSSEWQKPARGC